MQISKITFMFSNAIKANKQENISSNSDLTSFTGNSINQPLESDAIAFTGRVVKGHIEGVPKPAVTVMTSHGPESYREPTYIDVNEYQNYSWEKRPKSKELINLKKLDIFAEEVPDNCVIGHERFEKLGRSMTICDSISEKMHKLELFAKMKRKAAEDAEKSLSRTKKETLLQQAERLMLSHKALDEQLDEVRNLPWGHDLTDDFLHGASDRFKELINKIQEQGAMTIQDDQKFAFSDRVKGISEVILSAFEHPESEIAKLTQIEKKRLVNSIVDTPHFANRVITFTFKVLDSFKY